MSFEQFSEYLFVINVRLFLFNSIVDRPNKNKYRLMNVHDLQQTLMSLL